MVARGTRVRRNKAEGPGIVTSFARMPDGKRYALVAWNDGTTTYADPRHLEVLE